MDERGSESAPETPHTGHHRSARERQRRGPMWGCLKALFIGFASLLLLLLIVVGGGWWYLGTASFADLIRLRIQDTLETRLGRKVTIHDVQIFGGRQAHVVLNDVRIANSPGAVNRYFATARQVEIAGGIESFWGRQIKVNRVDIRDPHINFEIYPAGAPLVHNFPHWESGARGKYDIYRLDIGTLAVSGGTLNFLDRKHDIAAVSSNLASEIKVTLAEDVYQGTLTSPQVRLRIQDYVPFDLDLRGGFRYTPGVLDLSSIAMRGRGMEVFLAGKVDPLADGVYNLHLTSQLALSRVREIFKVNKVLDGTIALDGNLRGKQGEFALTGGWVSKKISADVYDLAAVKGQLNITADRAVVDVASAQYGGGSIGAHYLLPKFSEPYPMSVDLRYNGVALEKLFNDWGVGSTGLRGAATGRLAYHWNKDKVLEGAGNGTATLSKSTAAFSDAKYPIPLAGNADFALDNGVVTFRRAELSTDASHIAFGGTLRIEDLFTDLKLDIHSSDFGDLDRAAYNFAQSAGKKSYTLLGLGGTGDIAGTVKGKIKTPQVVAHIVSTATKYNNALLGNADIDLHYDGVKSVLTFDRSTFTDPGGRLSLTGNIGFPDRGPSPTFDLAIESDGYSVERALSIVDLPFKGIHGLAAGKLLVTGNKDSGKATFAGLTITQGKARLTLRGDVNWLPGKGTTRFNLDIAATDFPVNDIIAFLDLGTFPVTGNLTGKLHMAGSKTDLSGTGAVTVRNGTIYGEPVESVSADLAFSQGKVKATNVAVTAPSGQITGQAELDLTTNQFDYTIQSAAIDLSKIKLLQSLAGLLGGKVKLTSTGAGTFDHPEVVLEATLSEATLKGLTLPPDAPPPTLYIALRNGRLIIRGSAADVLTIEGDAAVGADLSVDGMVKIAITDVGKLLALSPASASLPASGHLTMELKLGGKLTSLEELRIDGSVPDFALKVSEHEFTAPQPLRFTLAGGRVTFDQFTLQRPGSAFSVTGSAELTGQKRLNVNLRGEIEAALLQLFVAGLRADGHINVTAGLGGTLGDPRLTGSAELRNAQFRFPGFPQLIDQINGTLIFRGDRIDIDSLRAQLGGGNIVVGGFVTLDGFKPQRARISLQGTGVAIRYFEGLTVEGNFNLLLSGDTEHAVLQGDVDVTRALYFKDFDFRTSLLNVILSRRGVAPVVAASWQDKVAMRLHVVATNTLAVRNNIGDVTGSAEIDVTGTLANPSVLGLVTLNEGGHVRFQNVDYRVVRGSINFQNPFRIDPYFDVTVEGRVSGGFSEVESGPIDVTVNLNGTIDRFTPTVTSDPPASDITLFSLLGFGGLLGSSNRNGATTSPNASLVGQSLLYQSLGSLIGQKILPFADSFTYDPGLLDTSADPGPKVSFERRVTSDIRLLVIYNLKDNRSRAVVEWQVNPDWTVQFTSDEIRKEYRAEARFRRRYQGHWTWGGHGQPVTLAASLGPITGEVEPQGPATTPPIAAPTANPSAPAAADGARIVSIGYRADAGFDTSILRQYLQLAAGQPLALRAVQSSIKSLFATGDFRDIRVESEPVEGGVAVTFVLSLNYRIGGLTFDGLRGTTRDRAERLLTLRSGDVLSLNGVDRGATAIQELLNRTGYLEATVDPETIFDRNASRANVIFHVTTGPRAKVTAVNLEGNVAPFSTDELIKRMKGGPGQSFRVYMARDDAERMRAYMARKSYRKADVDFLGQTYDAATKTVTLRYSAASGPIVQVEVAGVPRNEVKRLLPFRGDQGYSEDVVETAADDIVKSYQERGYYNASVDTEGKLDGNVWTTTFHIDRGEQFRLDAVKFTGNAKIPDDRLRAVVATAPQGGIKSLLSSLFRRPTGPTRTQLSSDRDAVESYYRLNGFNDAQVATPVVNTDAATKAMTVDFPIVEGPQTLVTAVKIEGNEQVAAKELPKPLLHPGDPLNPATLRQDLVALQTFYADRGNAEVQITPRPEISTDKTKAAVTYVVAEGPKIKVDQVIVRGNSYTKTNVILRESQLDAGDPFSYRGLLETQRDLYRLGTFQRVEVQAEQAGTSVADRNVVISVEEGKDLTVAGSVGATKASETRLSPLLSASIAHRNLFGTGRYLGLETIFSRARQEAFLTFREPFVLGYNVPVQLTVFQSDEHRRGAHIRQRGTFIEASKVARYQTRWSIRYEYRISDCLVETANDLCDQVKSSIVPGLDPSVADIQISSITPTFFWDRRDDPLNPHRGFFSSASVEYAFPIAAAKASFTKEFAQTSYYLPLTARTTLAVSGRVGLIQPRGQDAEGKPLPVPFSERFTAGGESTHRAYALDLLGTLCRDPRDPKGCQPTLIRLKNPDTGKEGPPLPIGGNALLLANVEYRFPIFSALGGAAFVDIGNVYANNTIDFADLRYGIGTGLRYLSPVGPLRFDVAYKLNRRIIGVDSTGRAEYEKPLGYVITLGYAF